MSKHYGPPKRHFNHFNPQQDSIENRNNLIIVSEYLNSITTHLQQLETSRTINPSMIDLQPEVKWFMRPYLVNFIIQLHSSLKLKPTTLFLCWNIIDRYCAKRIAFKQHYQLIGCTSLWIASKYEDKKSRVPTVTELSLVCSKVYDESMFKEMEIHILSTLDWSIGHTSLEDILQLCIKFSNHDQKESLNQPLLSYKSNSNIVSSILAISRYLCELTLYERNYLNQKISSIGITAHLIACNMLQIPTGYKSLLRIQSQHNDDNNSLDCDYDIENIENKKPVMDFNKTGPFIQGYDSENTITELREVANLLLQSILNPPEVLIDKYEQLGVLTIIKDFVSKHGLASNKLTEQQTSDILLNTGILTQQQQQQQQLQQQQQQQQQQTTTSASSQRSNSISEYDSCSDSPFNSPTNSTIYSSFSSVSSSMTYDSSDYEYICSGKYNNNQQPVATNDNNGNWSKDRYVRYPNSSPITY